MAPDQCRITDQVAIVTGGGAGIGRAIALALTEAGADVVIADIIPERGAEVGMLAGDGLHPSAAMYTLWTQAALPVARSLLAR